MCPCTRLANAAPRRTRCSRGSVHGLLTLAVLVAALPGACENPLAPELCGAVSQAAGGPRWGVGARAGVLQRRER